MKHREAQARYRAKRALESGFANTIGPDIVDLRQQKHREAQARYQQKNWDHICRMRWVKTKEGSAFRLNMLAPVINEDSGCENVNLTVEPDQGL